MKAIVRTFANNIDIGNQRLLTAVEDSNVRRSPNINLNKLDDIEIIYKIKRMR